MKIDSFLILLTLMSLTWTSCSTDFEIAADWKESTVVYGLLNAADSVHYIRIQKAFLGEEVNAFDVAQIADSIYHEEPPSVNMEVYDIEGDSLSQQYTLQKIEGSTVDIEKEEGIFANDPHWLYQFSEPLTPDSTYQLVIQTQRGNTIKGITPIVGDFEMRYPDEPTDTLSFLYDFEVSFRTAPNGFVYSLYLHFNYTNKSLISEEDTLEQTETAIWPIFSNKKIVSLNDRTVLSNHLVESDRFFDFLLKRIPVNDTIVEREFVSMDLVFFVANEDFYNYDQFVRANLGLTSFHAVSGYTNLEGGVGVLASRYEKAVKNLQMTPSTLDAIACSQATRILKFKPSGSYPYYPFCL